MEIVNNLSEWFDIVEIEFKEYHKIKDNPDQNFCCNEEEKKLLLSMADILKKIYPDMSDKDICSLILYIYYSLNLNEQTTDPLRLNDLTQWPDNFNQFKTVYLTITTGEIMKDGIDYASIIRRNLLGLELELDISNLTREAFINYLQNLSDSRVLFKLANNPQFYPNKLLTPDEIKELVDAEITRRDEFNQSINDNDLGGGRRRWSSRKRRKQKNLKEDHLESKEIQKSEDHLDEDVKPSNPNLFSNSETDHS